MAEAITYSVIVKGPLLPFTRSLLRYYLDELFPRSGTGIVFSHNNASTCADTVDFLESLTRAHHRTFAYVLAAPPPRQGYGYRNAQREAVANGIELALSRCRRAPPPAP